MTTKTIIVGVNGAMGQLVKDAFQKAENFEVVAGIDLNTTLHDNGFPVFESFDNCDVPADLIVDFSRPTSLDSNLSFARNNRIPIIIATTGLSDSQKLQIKEVSELVPVFYTANMSLGVNLQLELCQKAVSFLGDSVDIEIIEKHHNRKVDAPSGTALLLANGINEAMSNVYHYQFGRYGNDAKRKPNEIGIHAIRGGNIAGDHEVSFIANEEILTIQHHTENRAVFAKGALRAAQFLQGKKPGLYSMLDILAQSKAQKKYDIEKDVCLISITNASCTISYLARLFDLLAKEQIQTNVISQSISKEGRVDLSFTIKSGNLSAAESAIQSSGIDVQYMVQNSLTKFMIYASGESVAYDTIARFTEMLKENNINLLLFSIIENRFVFYTEAEYTDTVTELIAKCF